MVDGESSAASRPCTGQPAAVNTHTVGDGRDIDLQIDRSIETKDAVARWWYPFGRTGASRTKVTRRGSAIPRSERAYGSGQWPTPCRAPCRAPCRRGRQSSLRRRAVRILANRRVNEQCEDAVATSVESAYGPEAAGRRWRWCAAALAALAAATAALRHGHVAAV